MTAQRWRHLGGRAQRCVVYHDGGGACRQGAALELRDRSAEFEHRAARLREKFEALAQTSRAYEQATTKGLFTSHRRAVVTPNAQLATGNPARQSKAPEAVSKIKVLGVTGGRRCWLRDTHIGEAVEIRAVRVADLRSICSLIRVGC